MDNIHQRAAVCLTNLNTVNNTIYFRCWPHLFHTTARILWIFLEQSKVGWIYSWSRTLEDWNGSQGQYCVLSDIIHSSWFLTQFCHLFLLSWITEAHWHSSTTAQEPAEALAAANLTPGKQIFKIRRQPNKIVSLFSSISFTGFAYKSAMSNVVYGFIFLTTNRTATNNYFISWLIFIFFSD